MEEAYTFALRGELIEFILQQIKGGKANTSFLIPEHHVRKVLPCESSL